MQKRLRYILLIILLAVASGAAGQGYVIDSVCLGAERHYRIDGEVGSTYRWTLTDPQGAIISLPETADTVTITWSMGAGEFILSAVQTSIHGCDTLELGSIMVFELPFAYAGSNMTVCTDTTVLLSEDSASNYVSLLWTTSGDGNFDNNSILHPTYIPGPDDLLAGSVVLTITATGNGRAGACPPAESSLTVMLVPVISPVIVIEGAPTTICSGSTVNFTSNVTGEGSAPEYQWRVNGISVAEANGASWSSTTLADNDVVSCVLTSSEFCANPATAISNEIIMTVNPLIVPTITITADHNPVCPGTLVTFTTSVTNEGISPFYRWRKNGIIVGTNNSSYTDNTILNNDVIACTLISSEACADPDSVTSNTVMMVSPPLTPTIVIAADQNPICQGALVTFTSAITNGGLSPIYEWKKNGISVGTNDSVYRDSTLFNNDIIACRLWSSERCIDSVYVASNIIVMVVNPLVIPAISIYYDHNPSCFGALVTFTSNSVNPGLSPVYRWWKNGAEVGTNNPIYTDSTIINGDLITCTLFSSETCAKPDSAISNSIVMVVSPAMTAAINEHTDIMCYGDPNGSASVIVSGGSPDYSYLWNTVPVQTTQIAINLTPGIYNVTVTDLIGCTAADTIIIAGPAQPLTVIATSTDVNCVDANNGMAMAMVSGGTPGYTYLWNDPMLQINDTAINLVPGTYIVIVTDTNLCTETATVDISEPVTREPKITISIDNEPVCRKSLVHFTSNVVYPGSNPFYQWTKNGVNVGTNDSVYSDSTLTNSDVINCIFTSSEPCAVPATKISNGIQINVYEPPVAAFTINEIPDNITGNIQLDNNSSGAVTYYWDFGNGQNSTEENPTVSYFHDGNFLIRLIAYSVEFCTDTATNKFKLDFYGLYIPNAFAPESSSSPANVFKPVGTNLRQYRIEVYDSWGNLMWESNALDSEGSPSEAWDGKYKQELMPQGTYMWKVNAIFNDNTIWQGCDIGKGKGKTIGTVTLIR